MLPARGCRSSGWPLVLLAAVLLALVFLGLFLVSLFLARRPTGGPAFLQISRSLFWDLVPCNRSHASAGHLATIRRVFLFRQPSRVGPADRFRTS